MNRHAGASFTLSVLIVIFFGIVLYEPEGRKLKPPAEKASTGQNRSEPHVQRPASPVPTPGVPLADAEPENDLASTPVAPLPSMDQFQPPVSQARPQRVSTPSTLDLAAHLTTHSQSIENTPKAASKNAPPPPRESDPPVKLQTVSRRQPVPTKPRSAFTETNDGESLRDVASRVYGDPESVRTLWLANRDILPDPNAPLPSGTLLRTP